MMDKKKILVVDDDEDLLRLLSVRLKGSGYEVYFAMDGVSCMKMAQEHHPDLILLDLGLPAGDGFQVLERLQDPLLPFASIPVVVLTGRDDLSSKVRVHQGGAKAFLRKPFDKEQLLSTINRWIGNTQQPIGR